MLRMAMVLRILSAGVVVLTLATASVNTQATAGAEGAPGIGQMDYIIKSFNAYVLPIGSFGSRSAIIQSFDANGLPIRSGGPYSGIIRSFDAYGQPIRSCSSNCLILSFDAYGRPLSVQALKHRRLKKPSLPR
jgi:hypothetical protein